jgi:SAM-dependent methyltransferase
MNWSERIEGYRKTFPKFPPPVVVGKGILGVWMIGNNYKSATGYYGEYPPSYMRRVMSMFPDKKKVLHLFSGAIPPGPYTRLDANPANNPDIVGDAQEMKFKAGSFDLILADPPYTEDDSKHYGTPMPNRFKVTQECARVLKPDGHLVWLDTVFRCFGKRN